MVWFYICWCAWECVITVYVCVESDKTYWISTLIHFLNTSFIVRAFLPFLILITLAELTLKPNSVTPRLLLSFTETMRRMSEQDGGHTIPHYYHFCAKQVFPDSHAQTHNLYFNTGSKTETQCPVSLLVKQQQVRDTVFLNVKTKENTNTSWCKTVQVHV